MDYKNALCVGRRASSTRLTLHGEKSFTTLEASSPNLSRAKRMLMDKTQNLTKSLFQNRQIPKIFTQKISGSPLFWKKYGITVDFFLFSICKMRKLQL